MFPEITNGTIKAAMGKIVIATLVLALALGVLSGSALFVSASTSGDVKAEVQAVRTDINLQNTLLQKDIKALDSRLSDIESGPSETGSQVKLSSFASTAVPSSEEIGCVNKNEVVYLRYIKTEGSYPIPVGSVVEFVSVCNTSELALKWVEIIGSGRVIHVYSFEGVNLDYEDYYEGSSSSTYRNPLPGDIGRIYRYYDSHGPTEETRWISDGIVDGIGFEESRVWTPEEVALIGFGNEFYEEAVKEGFFYLSYATDCSPTSFLVNGEPAKMGPYEDTFYVPEGGGELQAFYKAGKCGWYPEDTIRWSLEVNVGEIVEGTEDIFVISMKDRDPYYFCGTITWMAPVWQSSEYVPNSVQEVCPALYSVFDNDTLATLPREGFQRSDSRYGDDIPDGWVPFVFNKSGSKIKPSWPEFQWVVRPDGIVLDEDNKYEVSTDISNGNKPVFNLRGGDRESTTAYGSDVPWYEWGTPLIFVKSGEVDSYTFDWKLSKMFRVALVNDQVLVEEAIWSE